mmetsp:Transcript_34222/g.81080  ORF Transcript_34222/g.81080 Transcript_34222/m.81080 type:complete len:364 (-) Transcript_34222:8-1099(-)
MLEGALGAQVVLDVRTLCDRGVAALGRDGLGNRLAQPRRVERPRAKVLQALHAREVRALGWSPDQLEDKPELVGVVVAVCARTAGAARGCLAGEHAPAAQDLEEYAPHGPLVDERGVVCVAHEELGRAVPHRRHLSPHLHDGGHVLRREPEVAELHGVVGEHQHVRALDVPMQNRVLVQERHGFQDLARPVPEGRDGRAELEALDYAVEVRLPELEHDARHVLGRADHRDDVGVVDGPEDLDLARERLADRLGRRGELAARLLPVEVRVRERHLDHPANPACHHGRLPDIPERPARNLLANLEVTSLEDGPARLSVGRLLVRARVAFPAPFLRRGVSPCHDPVMTFRDHAPNAGAVLGERLRA